MTATAVHDKPKRGRARTSSIAANGKMLRTPAALLPTHRGQLPYLPASLLPTYSSETFALSISAADVAVLNAKTGLGASALTKCSDVDSFAKLASLPTSALVFLVLRGAGSEAPTLRSRDGSVIVHSRAARVPLTPKNLADLHCGLATDFVESASGTASGATAVARFTAASAAEMRTSVPARTLFASAHVKAGAPAAREASISGDAGVSIAGAYGGETSQARLAIVDAAANGAHPRRSVLVPGGTGEPSEVLNLVHAGADIVEARFPFECGAVGEAIDFSEGMRVLLRDASFARSKAPLVEGCGCGVCGSYSRAYIHHLYAVHEMLAPSLVAKHNLWCYLRWFGDMRAAIESGSFDGFRDSFFSKRAQHIAQGVRRGVRPL